MGTMMVSIRASTAESAAAKAAARLEELLEKEPATILQMDMALHYDEGYVPDRRYVCIIILIVA